MHTESYGYVLRQRSSISAHFKDCFRLVGQYVFNDNRASHPKGLKTSVTPVRAPQIPHVSVAEHLSLFTCSLCVETSLQALQNFYSACFGKYFMTIYKSEIKMEQKTNIRIQFTLAAALPFSVVQRKETAVTDEFSEISHISGIKFHYTIIPLADKKFSDSFLPPYCFLLVLNITERDRRCWCKNRRDFSVYNFQIYIQIRFCL